jgi:hypothetical protein
MPPLANNTDCLGVFRDEIKETRGTYYVTYQAADARYDRAFLQVTVSEPNFSPEAVCRILEQELGKWLKKYPVPVWATAWDVKEDGIKNPSNDESILMGYADTKGNVIQKWGIIQSSEFPPAQSKADYLARVYSDVKFQLQEEVRKSAKRKWRQTAVIGKAVVLFMVVIPFLIEVVSLGVAWLGYLLSAISITAGLHKVAKASGWIKPSERKKQKEAEERRMAHYSYHCERNPDGFNRLKAENFQREAIERTRKEADEARATGPSTSTIQLQPR